MIYISYVDCIPIYVKLLSLFLWLGTAENLPILLTVPQTLSKTYTRWEIPDHAGHALKYTMIV